MSIGIAIHWSEKKNNLSIFGLVWFGLVWFYDISTIVGYLMPNPVFTYKLNIYDLVWVGFMVYLALLVI